MSGDDLSFVTTEAMLKELRGRFDSMVFGGVVDRDKKGESYALRHWGSIAGCYGLLSILNHALDHDLDESMVPEEGDNAESEDGD